MKVLGALLGLVALAAAQFNYDDWHAPGPKDLRGPCPALNALANHGFLPRDGRNITQSTLIKGVSAVNLSVETTIGLFLAGLKTSSDPASGAFTLQDLKKHNIIEHDGSLSRADTGTPGANDQAFNADVFGEFKSLLGSAERVSLPAAAAARWGRIRSARGSNAKFSYGAAQRFNSYAETAVYFQVLQDPRDGTVPMAWLEPFFCEERLPAKEGWHPPATPITGLASASVILQLAMLTDEKNADLVIPPSKRGFSHMGEAVL